MIKNRFLYFVLLYLPLAFFSFSSYSGSMVRENPEHKGGTKIGIASWYGKRFHGKKTASGKNFDMYNQTAAHRSLPLGTRVR
ncbi:MAG: septal ring lytic transglycosylase RlpA family protein, partial [Thermodesulfobacteriota bacterium]